MYAVVTSGGKQYRVEAGSEFEVERLAVDAGSTITFDRVLLVGDGEDVTVGTPTVQGASVSGTVLGEVLGPKLIVFKFKQKATYRRKNGHRQHLTRVRIDEISAGGRRGKASKADAAAAETEAEPVEKPATRRRTAKAAAGDEKPKATARTRTTKASGTKASGTKAQKASKAEDAEQAEE